MPAALSASCVLVTTSTFGGSAGAARFWPADAVTGSIKVTARLSRAGPRTLVVIPLPLLPCRFRCATGETTRIVAAVSSAGREGNCCAVHQIGQPPRPDTFLEARGGRPAALRRDESASQGSDLISGAAPIGGLAALGLHAAPCRYAHSLRCACSRFWPWSAPSSPDRPSHGSTPTRRRPRSRSPSRPKVSASPPTRACSPART